MDRYFYLHLFLHRHSPFLAWGFIAHGSKCVNGFITKDLSPEISLACYYDETSNMARAAEFVRAHMEETGLLEKMCEMISHNIYLTFRND